MMQRNYVHLSLKYLYQYTKSLPKNPENTFDTIHKCCFDLQNKNILIFKTMLGQKNIYVCFSSEKIRYGQSDLLYFFLKFYMGFIEIASNSSQLPVYLLKFSNKFENI